MFRSDFCLFLHNHVLKLNQFVLYFICLIRNLDCWNFFFLEHVIETCLTNLIHKKIKKICWNNLITIFHSILKIVYAFKILTINCYLYYYLSRLNYILWFIQKKTRINQFMMHIKIFLCCCLQKCKRLHTSIELQWKFPPKNTWRKLNWK